MASAIQCPFLYQTRTILRQQSRVYRPWRHSTAFLSDSRTIQPDLDATAPQESNETPNFLQQKAIEVLARKSQSKSRSAIPKQERVSIDEIWKLFESSTSPPLIPQKQDTATTARNHTDTDHEAILELFSSAPEQDQRHEVNDQEAQTISQSATPFSTFLFSTPPTSRTTKSAAVAEIADYLSDQPKSAGATQQNELLTKTAQKMMSAIFASLDTALNSSSRPDHAIWCIAEEKVFPLIKLLVPPRSSLSKLPGSPLNLNPAQSHQPTKETHPLIPPSVPLLPLLSRIYPAALLLILRLLYTQTPTSPFISALLPHIKSLGPTSYVLGVNTFFYNLLLTLRWNVYSDFRGIDHLLGEMERNGVEFDTDTLRLLKSVEEERDVGVHGKGKETGTTATSTMKRKGDLRTAEQTELDYGSRGRDWWTRLEVKKGLDRIEEWKAIVTRKLEEKGLGEVMREGGDIDVKDQNDREDAYVVTL